MADKYERWNKWAPQFIADLMHDFGFTDWQAAGFVGNFAAESAYFNDIVEDAALAKGWAGGTGFAQWTAARRKTFEAWIRRKGWAADSYEGNYSYLFRELKGYEPRSITGLAPNIVDIIKGSSSAENAAWRVAAYFEKPAVINIGPRAKAANEALALYRKNPVPPTVWPTDKEVEMPTVPVTPVDPPAIPWYKSPVLLGGLAALGGGVGAIFQAYNPALPLMTQADVLIPLVIAAGGGLVAAFKRWTATAQPITGTQAGADQATVNKVAVEEPYTPVPIATPLEQPLEQVSLQKLAHEMPKVIELLAGLAATIQQIQGVASKIGTVR